MPKNKITRPTLSRVREAVFNILAPYLPDAVFWDLFSGSGAVGLTALSHGAKACLFVEEERAAVAALRRNIEEAKRRIMNDAQTQVSISMLAIDLQKAWPRLSRLAPPDLVWADPPYSESVQWAAKLKLQLAKIAHPGCILVLELQNTDLEAAGESFLLDPVWETVKTRKYGGISIVIWRKHSGEVHQ